MKYERISLSLRRQVVLCGTNFYTAPDVHPNRVLAVHDLLYILEGEWTICQDETRYVVRGGDVIFLHAHGHHYGLKPCAPNTRAIFAHFTRHEYDQSDVELTEEQLGDQRYDDFACFPTVVNCSHHAGVGRSMQQLLELYWSDRPDKQRQMVLQLNVLLCELAHAHRDRSATEAEWLPRVLEQMRLNPSKMYQVEELARLAGMSRRTFTERFKQAIGQSPHQYQINTKLETAFAIVRAEPGRTLNDIATHLGFFDAYHFSRVFKARYGFSPKHFRRGTSTPVL